MERMLKIEISQTVRALGLCQEVDGNPDECWKCPMRDRNEGCMNALHDDAAKLIGKLGDRLEKGEGTKSQTPGILETVLSQICDSVCRFRQECGDSEELEAHCLMCPLIAIG